MDLLEKFSLALSGGKKIVSPVTIRNYKADIGSFIKWFEKQYQAPFDPLSISALTLNLYTRFQKDPNGFGLSASTSERHLSSLRKFFSYLQEEDLIATNPLQATGIQENKTTDPWSTKEFKDYLFVNKSSNHTIKNYINDIRHFMQWAQEVTGTQNAWNNKDKNVYEKLDTPLIHEYARRLVGEAKLSGKTVNRKLSSIRKYLSWKEEQGYGKRNIIAWERIKQSFEKNDPYSNEAILKQYNNMIGSEQSELMPTTTFPTDEFQYSSFAPLRLSQKTMQGLGYIFDLLITRPVAHFAIHGQRIAWKIAKKPVFLRTEASENKKIQNIPKSFYSPESISTKYLPWHKRLTHNLLYTRPNWYKKYHSYPIAHYFHFAILIVIMSAVGFGFYQSFFAKQSSNLPSRAVLSDATRTFAFEGQLTDSENNPITTAKPVTFSLYSTPIDNGQAPVWQEKDTVSPDIDGSFSIQLGGTSPIPQDVFTQNSDLFLGVSIGSDPELIPRQQLATVSYAASAETLQGLSPITEGGAGTKNVVLALDSSGNLAIGHAASPVFQATGGSFTLSGQSLILTTNVGSASNLELTPDGTGKIDIQKPIFNSTNNNNIPSAIGSVEIDDSLSVLATSSGQSAFTVNQNGTGPLISASSSATAKFTVSNDGSGYFAGNLGVGIQEPITKFHITGATVGKSLAIFNETGDQNILTASASGTTKFSLDRSGDIFSASGAKWQPLSDANNALNIANASGSVFTTFDSSNGRVGIGTATPGYKLDLTDNQSATVSALLSNTDTGSDADVLALKVGATTASTTNNFVAFLNGNNATIGSIQGNGSGGVSYQTSGSDFAEYYKKENPTEQFQTGDLVCLGQTGNATKCSSQTSYSILGVVSENPGFVGGSNHTNDTNYLLVALTGQVPIKVYGTIQPSDPLTVSQTTGVATKATQSGFIVGRALQGAKNTNQTQTSILVSINVSWYDPTIFLTNSGNISIVDQSKNNTVADYSVVNTTSNSIATTVGSFAKVFVADIETGIISAKSIKTDELFVKGQSLADYILTTVQNQKMVSPIADIDQIHTSLISPLDNSQIGVTLTNGVFGIRSSASSSGVLVAQIDSFGNASFSGTLTATDATISGKISTNSIEAEQNISKNLLSDAATISGTLHAANIIADNIDLPQSVKDSLLASLLASASANASENQTSANTDTIYTSYENLATSSATTKNGQNFLQGVTALGPSSFSDVSLSGQLSVGGQLVMTNRSIDVLGTTLALQPLRQGNFSVMNGLFLIDTDGNLTTEGNASFAKDVTVSQTLRAHLLSPIPGDDFTIRLASSSAQAEQSEGTTPSFVIQNASTSSILTIDQKGNVAASGSGSFQQILSKDFGIVRDAQADTSFTETVASSSAGTATITAGQTKRTIITPYVKKGSLIYISATSNTTGNTPYVARQSEESQTLGTVGSFTVEIPKSTSSDIHLNWWIIN